MKNDFHLARQSNGHLKLAMIITTTSGNGAEMFSPFLFFWGGGGMNESWLTNTLIGEMEDQLKNLWWTLFNLVLLWDVVGIPSVKVVGRWRSVADSRSFFCFVSFLFAVPPYALSCFLFASNSWHRSREKWAKRSSQGRNLERRRPITRTV